MSHNLTQRALIYLVTALCINSGGEILAQDARASKDSTLLQFSIDKATRRGVKSADGPLVNFARLSAGATRYPRYWAQTDFVSSFGPTFDKLNFNKAMGEQIKLGKFLQFRNRQAVFGFGRFNLSLRSRGIRFQIVF